MWIMTLPALSVGPYLVHVRVGIRVGILHDVEDRREQTIARGSHSSTSQLNL